MPQLAESQRAGRRTVLGLGVVGALLTAGVVAVILHGVHPEDRVLSAVVHALGVALPVGLGLFRLANRSGDRFAWLLVGTGFVFSFTALAETTDPTLYSVGRMSAWVVEPLIVALMLAFPFGRLETPVERRIVRATFLVAAALYLPSVLVLEFPEPAPWASCGTSCPANAFMVTESNVAAVEGVVRPLREVATFLLYVAVAFLLLVRTRRSVSVIRHVLAPVAAVAVYRAAAIVVYQVGRAAGAEGTSLDVLAALYLLTLPLVAASFAIGLLRQRLFVADALERVTVGLRDHSNPRALRSALAGALGDPALRIVYWLRGEDGRWLDESGWPAKAPERSPGRAVTDVRVDGRRLAAITHDSGLDPIVVQAAGAHALTILENDRLVQQLQSSLDALGQSRARIAAVADRERRKIERDLHDGAQQRLVALRIKLELMAEGLERESPEEAAALRKLEDEVETTIDEVRSFARGIYPPVLAQRGLGEALRVASRSAPIPTTIEVVKVGRHRPEIEASVYFACMEALQNAAKHADGATRVDIKLVEDGRLRFEVCDDGNGFVAPTAVNGHGLTNLRDRIAAVGGEVEVRSEPGHGTTVTGAVPVG